MNRIETQDSLEPRIDRRFWFGPPAVVDTGAERLALRRIQIVHDTSDLVEVEVSFLNKPAIHRKVTATRRLSCQVGGNNQKLLRTTRVRGFSTWDGTKASAPIVCRDITFAAYHGARQRVAQSH